jgi:hypothetical protein
MRALMIFTIRMISFLMGFFGWPLEPPDVPEVSPLLPLDEDPVEVSVVVPED